MISVLFWQMHLGMEWLPLLPDTLELSGLTAFLVNVKLMAKPLNDVGKVYAKWQEAYPAFVNTIRA